MDDDATLPRDLGECLAWLRSVIEVAVTTVHLAAELALSREVSVLATVLGPFTVYDNSRQDGHALAADAATHGLASLRMWHHLAHARESMALCRFEEARDALTRCVELADRARESGHLPVPSRAELEAEQAEIIGRGFRYDSAITLLEHALSSPEHTDGDRVMLHARGIQAFNLAGRPADALASCEYVLAREEAAAHWATLARLELPRALRELDRLAQAEAAGRESMAWFARRGVLLHRIIAPWQLAEVLVAQGRRGEAHTLFESAFTLALEQKDPHAVVISGSSHVRNLMALGREDEAEETLTACTRASAAAYGPPLSVNYTLAKAVALAPREGTRARALFESCLHEAEAGHLRLHLTSVRLALSAFEARRGAIAAARVPLLALLRDPTATPLGRRLATQRLATLAR